MSGKKQDLRAALLGTPIPPDLLRKLLGEYKQASELYNQNNKSSFHRRTLFRNIFSFVEGTLHYLKAFTYSHYIMKVWPQVETFKREFGVDLEKAGFFQLIDEDVLIALLDRRVQIDEDGKWDFKEEFIQTRKSVRLLARVTATIFQVPNAEIFTRAGWKSFQDCVETRNRVTHPKVMEEFEITDEEVRELDTAMKWYNEEFLTVIINTTVRGTEWGESDPRLERLLKQVPPERRGQVSEKLLAFFNAAEDEVKDMIRQMPRSFLPRG